MGLAVVEDIPLAIDALNSAVVVAGHHQAILLLAPIDADVAVGDQHAAEDEIAVRIAAGGVAQLMLVLGGVDEIVGLADLSDAAGLEEGMALEAGAVRRQLPRHDTLGEMADGEHVVLQFDDVRAHHILRQGSQLLVRLFKHGLLNRVELILRHAVHRVIAHLQRPAVIQADHTLVVHDGRVKGDVGGHVAAIGVADAAVVFKGAVGLVAHRHMHGAGEMSAGHGIVQVIAAIIALHAVGGIHGVVSLLSPGGILLGAVGRAGAAPVGQVVHRGRPHLVIQHAEIAAALLVMGAVDINAVTEDVGLAVRDVNVQGQIRVIDLLLHDSSPFVTPRKHDANRLRKAGVGSAAAMVLARASSLMAAVMDCMWASTHGMRSGMSASQASSGVRAISAGWCTCRNAGRRLRKSA